MKIHYFIAGLAAAVVATGTASTVSAQQYHPEHQGTFDQQMACTGDVFRLCSREIPDEGRITNCLRDNVPSLSRRCRAVFEPETGSLPPPPGQRRDRRDDSARDAYRPDRNNVDNDNFDRRPPPPTYDNRRDRDDDD